jgi:hypothetical protein
MVVEAAVANIAAGSIAAENIVVTVIVTNLE